MNLKEPWDSTKSRQHPGALRRATTPLRQSRCWGKPSRRACRRFCRSLRRSQCSECADCCRAFSPLAPVQVRASAAAPSRIWLATDPLARGTHLTGWIFFLPRTADESAMLFGSARGLLFLSVPLKIELHSLRAASILKIATSQKCTIAGRGAMRAHAPRLHGGAETVARLRLRLRLSSADLPTGTGGELTGAHSAN